ncbi:MAG TPA: YdiU family protein [Burkholderiaceae bacterium]|nr:YdiU family protein [Burkholderiaceae bacterium]
MDARVRSPAAETGPAADGGPVDLGLRFDNRYARLPEAFYTRLAATPLPDPYLVAMSEDAASRLGLDPARFGDPDLIDALTGNRTLAGTEPLAAVYSGHQFGTYVPRLGDGRALLLGEAVGPDGARWEIQLKGSGKTPYSRMGDGRAVLRSSIREFLASEAMHGLGIPTTRALAVTGSDYPVIRETVESAAVVTRISPSFVRFGSFEYFYWTGQHDALKQLADFIIDSFYPEVRAGPQPYLAFIEQVARRTARLVARWQGVGFCHGVLNTDNMSILGLTIDYGPYGFIDGFDAGHICNHSDEHGRYAYDMQPQIGHWNLYALGQALVPLTDDLDATKAAIDTYLEEYSRAIDDVFRAKLGLQTQRAEDEALISGLIDLLNANRTDWTRFWRQLATLRVDATEERDGTVRDLVIDRAAFDVWAQTYRERLTREGSIDAERAARMNRANPKYVLRNHLVETAIRKARGDDGPRDFSEVARLLAILSRPYDEQPEHEAYAAEPPDWAQSLSLSCSS